MSGCGFEHGLVSIDEALQEIATHVQVLPTQVVEVKHALNDYLAEDVFSSINLPIFAQSAVDGYALCAQGLLEAGQTFDLMGEIRAGQNLEFELKKGQAVRIFTGAKIPKGTTTVARQEIVQVVDDQSIFLTENLAEHVDIRDAGEELTQGQLLASQGQQLTVGAIAALSMAGVRHVQVYSFPKIAVVVTGDEVAETVEDLNSGLVFDANSPMIATWLQSQSRTADFFHVSDERQDVVDLIAELKSNYDLILTTGGVSVGDYDFIRPVALEQGFEQIFWKVKQKPGKPMFFAHYQQQEQHCYLLGLPGNPAAVYVCLQVYACTVLDTLQGQKNTQQWWKASLTSPLKADLRERFLRMSMSSDAQGHLQVRALDKQQSHMLSNLMHSNCLVRIPAGQAMHIGETVQVLMLT